jgi:hypothetical protein
LYRMRRFYFALASDPELPQRSERIQGCLKEYEAVLYEWNDSLNISPRSKQILIRWGTRSTSWAFL